MPTSKQELSNLNNANYFELPRAVLVILNILRAVEANPVEMRLLCVAAVVHAVEFSNPKHPIRAKVINRQVKIIPSKPRCDALCLTSKSMYTLE